MGKIKKIFSANKIYLLLVIITVLVGAPPFVLYGSERLSGELPSYQEWAGYLGNHGPWWFSWKADYISTAILLMVALPLVTFLTGIILGLTASTKRCLQFGKGIGLVLLQLLWAYMLMLTMFWTID